MKPTSRYKRNLLIAAAIVICAVMVYLLWPRSNVLPPTLETSPSTYPHSLAARALSAEARVAALSKFPPPVARAREPGWEALLKKITTLLSGKKIKVCGLSELDAALFIAGDDSATRAVNTTLAEVSGKLVQSEKPREQALGLYVQANLAEWELRIADGAKYRICDGDFDCMLKIMESNRFAEVMPEARAAAAAPLVKLAFAERDPAIIATAIYACGGACKSISVADWAAVEPDNAAVWFMMADAASGRKDVVARNDALRRAAAASVYDLRVPPLASILESDRVKAQSVLTQSFIGEQLAGSNIAKLLPPTGAITTHCLHEKNADEMRNALCDSLATKLLDKDESIIGLITAAAVGKKLGWEAARLDAMRDERTVGMGMLYDVLPNGNMFGCSHLEKTNQWIQSALSKSERAIARERLANSGKTLAEFAEQYRAAYPGSFK